MPYLDEMPVADLHGIGWSINRRLATMGIETCRQLRRESLVLADTVLFFVLLSFFVLSCFMRIE